jgi:hypothetical protein
MGRCRRNGAITRFKARGQIIANATSVVTFC